MKKWNRILFALLVVVIVFSCKKALIETTGTIELDTTPYNLTYNTLPDPNLPGDNSLTVEKVKLGRMLFYENLLSGDGSMSCASCHNQQNAFSDTARLSTGIDGLLGHRQAMAIVNMAWNDNEFFWDGRAHFLRDQALKPIQDPLEMHETLPNAIAKLEAKGRYRVQFTKAFGNDSITSERMALALEAFMFTLVSNQSKYDRYLTGNATLSESEERGRALFFAEYNPFFPELSGADCAHCHSGSNFENDQYMNNGLDNEAQISDIGRQAVTNSAADKGKFKVPTLRNIALTFPYMHDGRFRTLEEVVEHYNSDIHSSTTLEPQLAYTMPTGLMLNAQDKIDLVNFLKALTDYQFIKNPAFGSPF
ncbi:MAG: cytochrome c peroxidase [Fluviicola sp.]|nr:cytochrome c peroxidase [Fluviicola sp.]